MLLPSYQQFGTAKVFWGDAPPAEAVPGLNFNRGDLIVNVGASQGSAPAWICVASGNPGTWASIGTRYEFVNFTIDGGGSVITAGVKGWAHVPVTGIITGWELLADQAGTIQIDTVKSTYSNWPTVGSSIWSTKPALSNAIKNSASALSIAINEGDRLRFSVDSSPTPQNVTLLFISLKILVP